LPNEPNPYFSTTPPCATARRAKVSNFRPRQDPDRPRLDAFGIDYIEGGWPGSNPKDVEFFREAKKLDLKHAKLAAFGSTRRADTPVEDDAQVRLLLEAETPVVTIFGKSWEMQVTEVLRTTVEENRAMIRDTVAHLVKHGREVIYDAEHFFDGYKDSPEHALGHAGSRGRRRRVLPGALRHERRHAAVRDHGDLPGGEKRIPDTPIGIHTHNDCELGVANAIAAVKAGANQIQGTINGYGERTGNCNLTSVIPILQLKMGLPVVPHWRNCAISRTSWTMSPTTRISPAPLRRAHGLRPQGRDARQRGEETRPQLRAHRARQRRQRAEHPGFRTQRPGQHPDQGRTARAAARKRLASRPRPSSPASRNSKTKATRSKPPAARSNC
jgi:hypothetical protein